MTWLWQAGRLGGREFRRLPLDEALPDLVAVEGVVHEECYEFVVVVVVVVGCCRCLNFLGLVRMVRCCSRPLLGEGPGVVLLVGRVR